MQVNSAQDYLTMKKRQIIASTFYSTPPEQRNKTNSVYTSVEANASTTRQRFILPTVSAWGGVPGTATFTNFCTTCETPTGAPGTFQVVNRKDVLSIQALKPISVTATRIIA